MIWKETNGGNVLIAFAEGGLSLVIVLNDLFEQAWGTKLHKYDTYEPVCCGSTSSVAHLELIESVFQVWCLSSEVFNAGLSSQSTETPKRAYVTKRKFS